MQSKCGQNKKKRIIDRKKRFIPVCPDDNMLHWCVAGYKQAANITRTKGLDKEDSILILCWKCNSIIIFYGDDLKISTICESVKATHCVSPCVLLCCYSNIEMLINLWLYVCIPHIYLSSKMIQSQLLPWCISGS